MKRNCGHLVPPAIRDVLPEQEEKLSEKPHGSQQLPAMMKSWKTQNVVRRSSATCSGYMP